MDRQDALKNFYKQGGTELLSKIQDLQSLEVVYYFIRRLWLIENSMDTK